ncbi:unnamed protein product [Dovyalis caffra]|uniref:Uncharacterized protein n=1 Tax=Dovyalis caffra TaxID=77055 RepID=A0AAV1R1N3_9ROSI|nr:unnamed protein product [Dovyalis caffra]
MQIYSTIHFYEYRKFKELLVNDPDDIKQKALQAVFATINCSKTKESRRPVAIIFLSVRTL